MRIAILDSDREQVELIRQELTRVGHVCEAFRYSPGLPAELDQAHFDAIVLDWHESGSTGLRILQSIADEAQAGRPVLLLAPRSSEDQLVEALGCGANDYLIKPIRRGELLVRMQVLLKRAYPETQESEQLHFGPFAFEPGRSRITRSGITLEVTQKEFELALLFFRNLGRPLSRAYILEKIWSRDADIPSRTIDTHVSRVRTKLGLRPENGFRLLPVYSYGYQLEQLAPAQ
ncbi:response regulator transcription factor [Noviherbaspirillum sp.]|jgi:DNA-binding response OmpR family regulator|uniref:response regulator transcription factor n=1 Tax=Noviherbaspirillum sp. TaxID=1926288 RepID=UPI0025F3E892|nr:response regulator transcription factor [Noviherbaspirillum sp.]